jgi:hypothetical protein
MKRVVPCCSVVILNPFAIHKPSDLLGSLDNSLLNATLDGRICRIACRICTKPRRGNSSCAMLPMTYRSRIPRTRFDSARLAFRSFSLVVVNKYAYNHPSPLLSSSSSSKIFAMSQRKQSSFSPEALQESAKRQVAEVLHTGEDAVTSGAWIYPIRVSRAVSLSSLLLLIRCKGNHLPS